MGGFLKNTVGNMLPIAGAAIGGPFGAALGGMAGGAVKSMGNGGGAGNILGGGLSAGMNSFMPGAGDASGGLSFANQSIPSATLPTPQLTPPAYGFNITGFNPKQSLAGFWGLGNGGQ